MYELLRHLKMEIDATKDQIVFNTLGTSPDLVALYNFRTGYLTALIHTQEWAKAMESKKMRDEPEE